MFQWKGSFNADISRRQLGHERHANAFNGHWDSSSRTWLCFIMPTRSTRTCLVGRRPVQRGHISLGRQLVVTRTCAVRCLMMPTRLTRIFQGGHFMVPAERPVLSLDRSRHHAVLTGGTPTVARDDSMVHAYVQSSATAFDREIPQLRRQATQFGTATLGDNQHLSSQRHHLIKRHKHSAHRLGVTGHLRWNPTTCPPAAWVRKRRRVRRVHPTRQWRRRQLHRHPRERHVMRPHVQRMGTCCRA